MSLSGLWASWRIPAMWKTYSTWQPHVATEYLEHGLCDWETEFLFNFKLRFKKQPTQLWSIAFQQGCHGNSMGVKMSFQQVALEQLDFYT